MHLRRGHPRFRHGLGLLLCGLGACRNEVAPRIEIAVGPEVEDKVGFVPKSAFFEYLEVPGQRNELEITLASYQVSCESYVPPAEGQASVRVVVVTPAGTPPAPGSYAFTRVDETGSAAFKPDQTRAVPKTFIGKRSHLFQPGGVIRMTRVVLDREGLVEGILGFEFAGDAKHPATSIKGSFRAKMCRLNRAPGH
jgi:hypothetical protein